MMMITSSFILFIIKVNSILIFDIGKCLFLNLLKKISEVFLEGKKKFGSFFAFHGSPVENFHSIIHNGIISALNKRSAHGFGSYLTTSLKTALKYARQSKYFGAETSSSVVVESGSTVVGSGSSVVGSSSDAAGSSSSVTATSSAVAGSSLTANTLTTTNQSTNGLVTNTTSKRSYFRKRSDEITCVAIVEVVDDVSVKRVDLPYEQKYFVVSNDDLMQVRELLVFKI